MIEKKVPTDNPENSAHTEMSEDRPLLSRTEQVTGHIREIEVPFMESLTAAYPEKGWRMCGPASIALSRILSTRLNIPIGRNLEGEHIEVALGIYDPINEPNHRDSLEEQTYIRYHLGNGKTIYIDPIYGLLMGKRSDLAGAIQIEEYQTEEIDRTLEQNHNIHPLDPNYPNITAIKGLSSDPKMRAAVLGDFVAALNDFRGTMQKFIGDSGLPHVTLWHKTVDIIQQFAPEWQSDEKAQHKQILAYNELMYPQTHGQRLNSSIASVESKTRKYYQKRIELKEIRFFDLENPLSQLKRESNKE